ncbi:hypothetical protein [Microseira sp. BLCC-F43]|uniref:hypothetical protein n=1 Tax=Microseira sp. BLCC-F43 TaxID=3153602 RepID=UPI0035BC453D
MGLARDENRGGQDAHATKPETLLWDGGLARDENRGGQDAHATKPETLLWDGRLARLVYQRKKR